MRPSRAFRRSRSIPGRRTRSRLVAVRERVAVAVATRAIVTALTTLLGTSWGSQAVQNAEALGVNPSALAATCVLESGCSQPSGGGGAQGVFQMFPAAYQEGWRRRWPQILAYSLRLYQGAAGMNDPTTEAIAASGYLMQGESSLYRTQEFPTRPCWTSSGLLSFWSSAGTQLANASPAWPLFGRILATSAASSLRTD